MRTLVVLSEVKWRYMRTRKQYLLAAWPPGWRVLFLEPLAFGRANRPWPRRDGAVTYLTVPFPKAGTTSGPYEALARGRIGRAVLDGVAALWTRAALLALGAGRPRDRVLLVANVLAWRAARRIPRRLAAYDMNDDPTAFHAGADWVRERAREALHEIDLVVACSTGLAARAEAQGARDVAVIGNGANVDAFRRAGPEPPALARLGRPRIGYVGAIAPWFDFDLVDRVAAAHPATPVVLVGPAQKAVRERLEALAARRPNVVVTGEVAYEDVPAYVAALDVCLIPFVRSPLTDVLNPNKLYEYFAAGRTVVTLDYSEEIRALDGALYLARDAETFVAAVGRALAVPVDAGRVREIAERNTWAAKAREYAELLARRAHLDGTEDRS